MYNGYTDTVTLAFTRSIPNPVEANHTPTLNVSVGGGQTVGVTMDTGSTGMAISSNYVNTTGLQPLGQGTIIYTSSNNPVTGTFYNLLNIFEINGKPVTNMRTGYVVSSTGVTLGLTGAQSSGFAMLKLTPNTIVPGNVWNRANMGVTVGTGSELRGS
jgi:hypothetical protein